MAGRGPLSVRAYLDGQLQLLDHQACAVQPRAVGRAVADAREEADGVQSCKGERHARVLLAGALSRVGGVGDGDEDGDDERSATEGGGGAASGGEAQGVGRLTKAGEGLEGAALHA